jgi:rhodanese-related sulfurtransferase
MLTKNKLQPVAAAAVRAMLDDGGELALIDVREELIFSQNHLLWARNVPLSRLELRFARLVPRKTTRIVLIDDDDGLASRAAAVLARAGYSDLCYLQSGVAAWEKAGFVTFSGVHVPSKAFGEFVEHDSGTPSIGAQELDALMRGGADIKVLDSRPFDEYSRISIPTGVNVPGAELVLRARDIAPSPATTIVVYCAGRTRSIIGAQSLINAGVPNKVVALRNGTMGWHLAGLTCAAGKAERAPAFSDKGLAWAKSAAEIVAHKFGVERIDRAQVEAWRRDGARTALPLSQAWPARCQPMVPLRNATTLLGTPALISDCAPMIDRVRPAQLTMMRVSGSGAAAPARSTSSAPGTLMPEGIEMREYSSNGRLSSTTILVPLFIMASSSAALTLGVSLSCSTNSPKALLGTCTPEKVTKPAVSQAATPPSR